MELLVGFFVTTHNILLFSSGDRPGDSMHFAFPGVPSG